MDFFFRIFYRFLVSRKKFEDGHDLADFGEMFYLTERKEKSEQESVSSKDDSKERREKNKLGSCASGIDLSEQIITRKVLRIFTGSPNRTVPFGPDYDMHENLRIKHFCNFPEIPIDSKTYE